jgi:DNA-binding MarR family transcriptional regulator
VAQTPHVNTRRPAPLSTESVLASLPTGRLLTLVAQILSHELRRHPALAALGSNELRALNTLGILVEVTPTQLSRITLVPPPTLTAVIDRLVADGLVQRTRSAADRRVVLLSLTADGRERVAALDRADAERVQPLIGVLGDRQRQLHELLLEVAVRYLGDAPLE